MRFCSLYLLRAGYRFEDRVEPEVGVGNISNLQLFVLMLTMTVNKNNNKVNVHEHKSEGNRVRILP